MKLRRLAEDFRVDELNLLPLGAQGPFAAYRLTKSHWTTFDALEHFARVLRVPRRNLAHAGLKDRHALTTQLITIRHGPRRSLEDGSLALTYLGQAARATGPDDIQANAFRLVLRSLSAQEVAIARQALADLRQDGLTNYFDDQRFGSFFPDHGFIAEAWIRADYEQALWLAFAAPQPDDDSQEREQKSLLRAAWGNWPACKQQLGRSHRRSIVTFLCDRPGDFKGAWGRVNGDLRGLYLSALQSDLWNAIANEFFAANCAAGQLHTVDLKTGPVHVPRGLTPEQHQQFVQTRIPLPSQRVKLEPGPLADLVHRALARRGWSLENLKVRYPRDRFFARSLRPVLLGLDNLTTEFAADELDPGKEKLTLEFHLPRGAYATMVIKRLGWDGSPAT